jgi:hypothetical protein
MHAVFENVVPMLLNVWMQSGKWKTFNMDQEDYHLHPDVWTTIGKACAESGNTIPAAFGCRVPNLAESPHESSAKSRCLFATHVGPALLHNRFRYPRFYQHFIRLVRLINACLSFDMTRQVLQEVRDGFAQWVWDFEW